jgi:hypothetical protein
MTKHKHRGELPRLVPLHTLPNGEVRSQENGELLYRRTSAGPAFWCKDCDKEHIFQWSIFDHIREHRLKYDGLDTSEWALVCIDGEHFGVTSPYLRVRGKKYVTRLIGIVSLPNAR